MVNLNSYDKYHIITLVETPRGSRRDNPRPRGCQHSRDSLGAMLAADDYVSINSLPSESLAVIKTHTCSKCGPTTDCINEKLPETPRAIGGESNLEYWEKVGVSCPACGETPDRVSGNTFYHNSFEEGMTKCECYEPTFTAWLKNPDDIRPTDKQCSTTRLKENEHGVWIPERRW